MNSRVVQHDDDVPLNLAQQILKELDNVSTANRPGFGVLEKSSVRGDGPNGGELLPVRSELHQGRDAPHPPRSPSHAFQREANLIQIDDGSSLSDLFFPTPAAPVPARTQFVVRCVLLPVHLASVE